MTEIHLTEIKVNETTNYWLESQGKWRSYTLMVHFGVGREKFSESGFGESWLTEFNAPNNLYQTNISSNLVINSFFCCLCLSAPFVCVVSHVWHKSHEFSSDITFGWLYSIVCRFRANDIIYDILIVSGMHSNMNSKPGLSGGRAMGSWDAFSISRCPLGVGILCAMINDTKICDIWHVL